jgi:hypothetical protein
MTDWCPENDGAYRAELAAKARAIGEHNTPSPDALIRAALEAAAEAVDTCDDRSVTEVLGELLCCNGYQCGCRGAHLGALLVHTILALKTKPEVLAAIKAKAAEGRT